MNIEISPLEARVIGSLIEKQITTPDQYPLSLNALVNACNQKSNRDPVLELEEAVVQRTVDELSKKHFIAERSGFGSRVPKYQHRFCNTEYGKLKFDGQELAVICELLLRGPQTPGELRSRAARMAPVADVTEIEATLTRLAEREDGPFVVRLAREPGRRDSRYAHLFGGPVSDVATGARESSAIAYASHAEPRQAAITHVTAPAMATAAAAAAQRAATIPSSLPLRDSAAISAPEVIFPASGNDERLSRLEEEVLALRAELNELKRQLGG